MESDVTMLLMMFHRHLKILHVLQLALVNWSKGSAMQLKWVCI